MKSSCKIYSFLRAVRGNWRNAIFVSCDCGNCMCGRTTPCSGFLLAVDECGQVILASKDICSQRKFYKSIPKNILTQSNQGTILVCLSVCLSVKIVSPCAANVKS